MSLAVLLGVSGCASTPSGDSTTAGRPAPPSTSAPASTAQGNGVAAAMVRRVCSAPTPSAVTSVIASAAPTFKIYEFGPSCVWYATTGTQASSALARAITSSTFAAWHQANPVTGKLTVGGYPAVRGTLHGGCMVLVDVDNVALDVELTAVTDPGCSETTALASTVVGSH